MKKIIFHIVFIITCSLLLLHEFPFISSLNQKVFDAIKFAEDSQAFTMYINVDKPLISLLVFIFFGFSLGRPVSLKSIIKPTLINLVLCSSIILSIALYLGAIRWDPKLPPESLVFLLNNLFIVCVAEEAFFRRYIQGHLQGLFKLRSGAFMALLVASIIFGLAHFKGGALMVALSSVAGLFYGLAYLKTGRIEAAVLTHFGFNLIHFLLFSYPLLEN